MQIHYDFFQTGNNLLPQKGRILISEPFLMDNYFKRSIVLITEHTEEGTVGFVLNKPINMKVNEIMSDFPKINSIVSLGGPVQTNTLHYIHTLGDIIPGSVKVIDQIFWGGEFGVIKRLLETGTLNNENIRFFLGYSGWQANQLDDELNDNAWVVSEIRPDEIMMPMSKMFWNKALNRLGKKFQMWANFPENPQMN
ncbi:MAG TPA: YqgE/AlgH family protein [Bacteroidales bacterium]|jgi:putative transcriptional regulator|nr:YqgE/AlgH family protein [Bacteroidales bacterium]